MKLPIGYKLQIWFMALLLTALMAGCGGGAELSKGSSVSTAKAITSYSLARSLAMPGSAVGAITGTASPYDIAVDVPYGTSLTDMVATFAASSGATVKVGGASGTIQQSGTTMNTFPSSPSSLAYTVIAADNSTAIYNVKVTVAAASDKTISAFSLAAASGVPASTTTAITGSISPFDILVTMPTGTTDLTALVATFTATGASSVKVAGVIQTSGTTQNDFSAATGVYAVPVAYVVTAFDTTTAIYNVTVAVTNPGPAGSSPDLKTASTYGVFASANAAVTLVDNSTGSGSRVNGNVGLMSGSGACNGCDHFSVSGVISNGDTLAAQAQLDFQAAYADASTRSTHACTLSAYTEIAGPQGACIGYVTTPGSDTTFNTVTAPTYEPGLYTSASTIELGVNKTIYLDARGNADAVFIFQAGSAITTFNGSKIILINGALAKNVWWVAGSDATLGYSSAFRGTLITNGATGITVTGGSTSGAPTVVEGRLLSAAAVVVGGYVTVTVPAP